MNEKILNVSQNLERLALKLKKRADIFLVGGYVRNAQLGFCDTDVDLASEISPNEMKSLLKYSEFKVIEKSKALGTVLIKVGDEEFEHTTFRKEQYGDNGKHSPEETIFVTDMREDAKRRDFACNAIYYNITRKRYVDIYSGIFDIQKRRIKCVETPGFVFNNDGLRILRMIRLSCELNFKIDKETYLTAKRMSYRLNDISGQRKFLELKQILYADKKYKISRPRAYLRAMEMVNDLKIFQTMFVPCSKVKFTMLRCVKQEDRFIALLIDIVNAVNPDSVQYYLNELLGHKGFAVGAKNAEFYSKIVCGYFDALNRRSNKEYFFKYFENFNIIREYLKYSNKKLYEKYNFFYRYILNQKIPVRVKDLNIDGNDIKKVLPKLADKKIGDILKTLLDEVFENEISNEKSELLKEVKKIGDTTNN